MRLDEAKRLLEKNGYLLEFASKWFNRYYEAGGTYTLLELCRAIALGSHDCECIDGEFYDGDSPVDVVEEFGSDAQLLDAFGKPEEAAGLGDDLIDTKEMFRMML